MMKWNTVSVENPTYDQSSLWIAGAALQILQRMTQRKPQDDEIDGSAAESSSATTRRKEEEKEIWYSSAADICFSFYHNMQNNTKNVGGKKHEKTELTKEMNEERMSFLSSFWRLRVNVNKNTIPYEIVFKVLIFINCMTLSDGFYTKLKLLILWKFQTNILYFRDVHVFTSVEFGVSLCDIIHSLNKCT